MKKNLICLVAFFYLLLSGASNHVSAYTINQYGPSVYIGGSSSELAIMEQNLGIAGATIEDFDDLNLIPGLTVNGPLYMGSNTLYNTWGDPSTNTFVVWPTTSDFATINISQGVKLLGIGFAWLYYSGGCINEMIINGDTSILLSPTNFSDFIFGDNLRNGYITIESDIDDPLIQTVEFKALTGWYDAYGFDYIALKQPSVPIPGAVWLLSSGLIGLLAFRRKFRKG